MNNTCNPADPALGADQPPTRPCQAGARPCKENAGWRRIVRNFTPSWFSINMGTGIVSILLFNLPYSAPAIRYISYVFFALNVALFTMFFLTTLARYILYPEIFGVMIRHPAQSLFLGCLPMGFATIVNMLVFTASENAWGNWAVYLAWALWWIDVIASVLSCCIVPFVVVHHHSIELKNITAALLLPVVPVVVAAASGGILAEALLPLSRSYSETTVLVSYVIWGLGQVFSLLIMSTYLLRLQLHDLPPREAIVSVFLPVGPFGQGGFAILQLGRVAARLFPVSKAGEAAGELAEVVEAVRYLGVGLYGIGVFCALCMWGAALGWLAFALMSISSTRNFPFNMGWWGFTFPLGVFATCTVLLARELESSVFRVMAMIFSLSVVCLWGVVAFKTLRMALTGELFSAPCLKDLRPKEQQANGDRTA